MRYNEKKNLCYKIENLINHLYLSKKKLLAKTRLHVIVWFTSLAFYYSIYKKKEKYSI